jgi:hypothetical protein
MSAKVGPLLLEQYDDSNLPHCKKLLIISVVETCRRLKIPVRDYLGSVLPGLGDFPVGRIAELTPTAWASRN